MTVPVSARLPARVGSVRGPGVRAQGPRRRLATGVVRAESPKQGSGTTSLGPFKVESESAGEAPKDDTPSTSGQSPNPPSSKDAEPAVRPTVSELPVKTEVVKKGLLDGALDEAKLIDWPSLGSASVQTGVVVLIIFGSTALLIAVNTALAQVSQLLF